MSAQLGLVDPDEVIAPYDVTLKGTRRSHKRAWSQAVLRQLRERLGNLGDLDFEIHAGADYFDWGLADGLSAAGATVVVPTEGIPGIGAQRSLYRDGRAKDASPVDARQSEPRVTRDAAKLTTDIGAGTRIPRGQESRDSYNGLGSGEATSGFAVVWSAIEHNAGQTFRQARGQAFTYAVRGNAIVPSTTPARIARSQFEQAWRRMPVAGPGELSDLYGPSYLFAILTDRRIRG